MNAAQLKALQTPLKEKFRAEPSSALATISTSGSVDVDRITVQVIRNGNGCKLAGLHPLAGGTGAEACAAEMLLEALVCCAGVTLGAVCTAMEIPIESARIDADGDLDFRGTLGISRDVPVGFTNVRLKFCINSSDDSAKLEKAVQLAERYCVVAQTLKQVHVSLELNGVAAVPLRVEG